MNPEKTPTIELGDAISIGWKHFAKQWVPWVLSQVIYCAILFVSIVVVVVCMVPVADGASTSGSSAEYMTAPATPNPAAVTALLVLTFVIVGALIILSAIVTMNSYRNAYRQTQGETIYTKDFFTLQGVGRLLLVSIVVALIVLAGFVLFIIPGFIAGLALTYALPAAAANPEASISEVLSEALRVFKENLLMSVLLVILLGAVTGLLANFTLGLSSLVLMPITYLIYVVAYLMGAGRNFLVPA